MEDVELHKLFLCHVRMQVEASQNKRFKKDDIKLTSSYAFAATGTDQGRHSDTEVRVLEMCYL